MDKIIERARKLLAMSQDSSSEHEAMIAAKRLHALLVKHNISLTDLEKSESKADSEMFHDGTNWPWKKAIMTHVAELYFCKSYFQQNRKNYASYFLVGTESNRLFASYILNEIYRVVEKEASKSSREKYGKVESSFITSFRNGAASRICQRCNELMHQAKSGKLQDEEGNTLPALTSTYEFHMNLTADWMAGIKAKEVVSRTNSTDPDGFARGIKTGNNVRLSRGLQSSSSPKLLS